MGSRLFLLLTSIEGLFVIRAILQSPSENSSARLFGLSLMRLGLLGFVLFFVLVSLGMLFASWVKRPKYEEFQDGLKKIAINQPIFCLTICFGIIGILIGTQSFQYATIVNEPVIKAFLERLRPLLLWLVLINVQLIILLLYWRYQYHQIHILRQRSFFAILSTYIFFTILWLWLAKTGYGFTQETIERGVFRNLGTPLIGVQIIIAAFVSFGIVWLIKLLGTSNLFPIKFSSVGKDLPLGILIWIVTFALWMSTPLKSSWFVDAPRPPNYTFSPNSDAYLYEAVSQSVLVGSGFSHPQWGPIVARPMYSALLALFHVLGGASYEEIIPWQIALLAAFPVTVFFITRTLHSKISGLMAAILVILRGKNAIELADTITVSHAKLLMADMPAALGSAIIILLAVLWAKDPKNKAILPLLVGGLVGFFVLIRLEIIALLVVIPIAGMKFWRRNKSLWIRGSILSLLGFLLMVSPWVWRNWQKTQQIYIINPTYEQRILEKFSADNEQSQIADIPSSSPRKAKLSQLQIPSKEVSGIYNYNSSQWSSPERMLHHFFNSLTQSVLYLPMSPNFSFANIHLGISRQVSDWFQICCSLEYYVRDLPYWWGDWDGNLAIVSIIPMGINLFILAIGISVLMQKEKYIGLIPVITSTLYFLFLALMNRSGGRWIQEVDWVTMVVFSIGLVSFLIWLMKSLRIDFFDEQTTNSYSQVVQSSFMPLKFALVSIGIFVVGSSLPMMERYIPHRYAQDAIEQRVNNLLLNEDDFLSAEEALLFQDLLNENVSVWLGKTLYPRFFEQGDGMDGLGGMYKRPFSRMEFFFVGNENHWATISQQLPVNEFYHGGEVLLIGKQAHYSFQIFAAVLYSPDEENPPIAVWSDDLDER